MPKAVWHGTVIAEAPMSEIKVVENNYYFPPHAVGQQFLQASSTHTHCPWKGEASYYDVVVDGSVNKDAAWYYPTPKSAAAEIAGYLAFWHGVKVEE